MKGQSKRFVIRSLRVAMILVTLIFSASAARAVNYTVDNTSDNPLLNACTAAANDCSLRGAILLANSTSVSDVLMFANTLSGQTIVLTGTALSVAPTGVGGNLRINGNSVNQAVTVSGGNLSGVFEMTPGSSLTIVALMITGGNAHLGGGIRNDAGILLLTGSTVYGNTATGEGGGMYIEVGGSATVINSTFSGNTATQFGGGIENRGTLTVTNSTISNNQATTGGGFETISGTTNFRNTIIANSTAGGDCVRTAGTVNAQYSLIEGGLACVNGTNSNNLTGDPNLGGLANNGGRTLTHALMCPSIAVDAGSNALALTETGGALARDQRDFPAASFPRVFNVTVDMGSFELQQVCNQAPVAQCQDVTVSLAPAATTAAADIDDGSYDPDGDPLTYDYSPPGPYAAGQTLVTLTVDDGTETDSCTGTVTVNQRPVALCQNVTVSLAPAATTAAASINNGSYDPDGDPITLMQSPPGPYPAGQTLVTLTVDDGLVSESCMATVTVNRRPVALCQNVTVSLAPAATTAAASINNGSYDPDGDPITLTQSPPGPYPAGQTLVTLTVNDGLVSESCMATVTVNRRPVALCQNVTVTLAPYATTAAANINNGSYDPDGNPITLTYSPPGPYPVGQTLVTLTVNDGLVSESCQGTVTVLYLFTWYWSQNLLSPPPPPWLVNATAGSDVNLRFSLSGFKGPNPYSSPPTWQRISCVTKVPLAAAQPAHISGVGTIFYFAGPDYYLTIVKTNAAWAGTCRRASIYLNDGSTHSLDYQFQ